jgi:hypothetical protein
VLLLRFAVLELAEVHDPRNRRLGRRGDLDQIQLGGLGFRQGFRKGDDAEGFTFDSDQPDFGGVDLAVDPLLLVQGYWDSPSKTKNGRSNNPTKQKTPNDSGH